MQIKSNLKVDKILINLIEEATEKALNKLFKEHKETFYYFTLTTCGEAIGVSFTACSKESLEKMILEIIKVNNKINIEDEIKDLKWSYADSPYSLYCYDEYFSHIQQYIINERKKLKTEKQVDNHIKIVINSMEKAMYNLDIKEKFNNNNKRINFIINVEVIPPDYTNIERVFRLNPLEAILSTDYINELELEDFKEYL